MKTYIEALNKIKESTKDEETLDRLSKIEKYVQGKLSPKYLMYGADESMRQLVYHTINTILNYKPRKYRYYIEAPRDKDFTISQTPSIIFGEIDKMGPLYNSVHILGPDGIGASDMHISEEFLFELEGDFSKYPNGVILNKSDWYVLLCKHPSLLLWMVELYKRDENMRNVSYMARKSTDEIGESIKDHIRTQMDRTKEEQTGIGYLDGAFLDGISFIEPIEYISKREIEWRDFGPLEDLIISRGKDPDKDFEIESPTKESLEEEPCDTDDFKGIDVKLNEIVDYLSSENRKVFLQGLLLSLSHTTERTVSSRPLNEKIMMFIDFITSYKKSETLYHFYWFDRDDILNARICNVPVTTFAKLYNRELFDLIISRGVKEVKTPSSENEKMVDNLTKLFTATVEREVGIEQIYGFIDQLEYPDFGDGTGFSM